MVVDSALEGADGLCDGVHGVLQFLHHVAMLRCKRLAACEDVDAQKAARAAAPAYRVNVEVVASLRANLVHERKTHGDVLISVAAVPVCHLDQTVLHAPAEAREDAGSHQRKMLVHVKDLHDAPVAADDVSQTIVNGILSGVNGATRRGRLHVLAQLVEILRAHFEALKRLPVACVAESGRSLVAVVVRRRIAACAHAKGGVGASHCLLRAVGLRDGGRLRIHGGHQCGERRLATCEEVWMGPSRTNECSVGSCYA